MSRAMARRLLPALSPSWIAARSASVSLERGEVLRGLSAAASSDATGAPFLGLPTLTDAPAARHQSRAVVGSHPTTRAAPAAVRPPHTRSTTLLLVSSP